jgi:hypothetical protein
MTHKIRCTFQPDVELEVEGPEYLDLLAQGVVLDAARGPKPTTAKGPEPTTAHLARVRDKTAASRPADGPKTSTEKGA